MSSAVESDRPALGGVEKFITRAFPLVLSVHLMAFLGVGFFQQAGSVLRAPIMSLVCAWGILLMLYRSTVVVIPRRSLRLLIFEFVLVGWSLVGSMLGTEVASSLAYTLWHLVGLLLFMVLVPTRRSIVSSMVRVSGFFVITSIALGLTGRGYLGGRLSGIFFNPNTLAIVSMVTLLGSLALLADTSRKVARIAWGALAGGAGFALVLTQTRAGLLGAAGGIIVLWVFLGRFRVRGLLAMLPLLLSLGLVTSDLWLSPFLEYFRLNSVAELAQGSGRTDLWVQGLRSVPYVGVFGVGLGAQETTWTISPVANQVAGRWIGVGFFNSYLQAALELGVGGLALWLGPIIATLSAAYVRAFKSREFAPVYFVAALSIITGLLINGIFESSLLIPSSPSYPYLWTLLGLISTFLSQRNQDESKVFSESR